MLLPLPSAAAADFADRPSAVTAARIARFACPATRMLLSSDGLTSTLLAAWLGTTVRVRRAHHRLVRAPQAPLGATALLRAGEADEFLVRRSVLAAGDGRDLSRNVVVARAGLLGAADRCLADPSALLGETLHAAGTGHRRSVLDAGRRPWDAAGDAPAAYKTYVLWHGETPLVAISELFHPRVVPAELAARPAGDAG
ncbi:hypothetical protein [Streptomyces hoynatensis]|uniref:Chorismate lyase n=1 Tax=Streptomyces hoynatensis TaxID=1141874 RepID=A0A3A9ZBW2_9ACTN|nr:hypothetical protein [Streptomyces hoynatensis]RKN45599.1 hypothetical protein D7294_03735 [Streptomyces hoynatensis]